MLIEADQYDRVADILKAVAHPVRLGVIALLAERKEMSVTELTQALEREQATVSQHLQKMKLFGFLGTRRDGKFVQYFLKEHQLIDILKLVGQLVGGGGG